MSKFAELNPIQPLKKIVFEVLTNDNQLPHYQIALISNIIAYF